MAMTAKRIGANRQKVVNEKRAGRPHRMRKIGKFAGIAALVCGAGFVIYSCSPAITARISDAFNYGKRTYADFRVVNCGQAAAERLTRALGSLVHADSNYIDRAEIVKAASLIPEIEKIKIAKTRDKATVIKVTERKPVAIAQCGDVCLIDKNGVRFTASPGQYYDLPLVNFGRAAGDTVDLSAFNTIKKTSRHLGSDFFSQISQIDLSDGSAVNLIFKSGRTEYILGAGEIEKRLVHVKKLTEKFWDEQEEPSRIDLRYRALAFSSM